MKRLLKKVIPPILADVWRGRPARDPIVFAGDYRSWSEAERNATGYATEVILERTRAALLKVKRGEAVAERDSLLLDRPEPPLAVLAGLLRAAAASGGRLHVVDFGGSLGSSYFQCRPFLAPLTALRWSVVEQPAHVACGQADFANQELAFFPNLDAACAASPRPDVLLFSSVLQYLPAPHEFLTEALARRIPCVILDRTAFIAGGRDRLTVQRVPEWIYPASYPAWFFAEAGLLAHFAPAYELLASFPAIDRPELEGAYVFAQGMIHQLRS